MLECELAFSQVRLIRWVAAGCELRENSPVPIFLATLTFHLVMPPYLKSIFLIWVIKSCGLI